MKKKDNKSKPFATSKPGSHPLQPVPKQKLVKKLRKLFRMNYDGK